MPYLCQNTNMLTSFIRAQSDLRSIQEYHSDSICCSLCYLETYTVQMLRTHRASSDAHVGQSPLKLVSGFTWCLAWVASAFDTRIRQVLVNFIWLQMALSSEKLTKTISLPCAESGWSQLQKKTSSFKVKSFRDLVQGVGPVMVLTIPKTSFEV